MKKSLVDILKEQIKIRARNISTFVPETMGFSLVWILEDIRARLIHTSVGLEGSIRKIEGKTHPTPILSPENTNPIVYETLQHSGDFLEGYWFPFWAYHAITLLAPQISEKYRLAASIIIGDGIVVAKELGLIDRQKSDPADIPASIAGTLAYLGVHYLSKKSLYPKMNEILQINDEYSKSKKRIQNN